MAAMACILPVVNAFPLPKKTVKLADCLFWQNWLFRVGFFSDRLRVSNSPSAVRCLLPERFCLERIQSPAGHSNLQRLLPFRAHPPTSKPRPPPKKIPRRGPPGVPDSQYSVQKLGGLRRGKVPGVGGLEGGPASSRGALPPRSSPSKVFFPPVSLFPGGLCRGNSNRGRWRGWQSRGQTDLAGG